jgi:hypothetical protein
VADRPEIGYALSSEEHPADQVGPDQEGFLESYAREILA